MSPSAKKVDAMRQELEKRNQGHLLRYWDQIQPQQQQMLFDDLLSIDFEEVMTMMMTMTQQQQMLCDDLQSFDF